MKYIAHRGNTEGPFTPFENHPKYIEDTINKGYYCEIDVWYISSSILIDDNDIVYEEGFYLGHDGPEYKIDIDFILKYRSWLYCHCKNIYAFYKLLKYNIINCFFHDTDDCTLTSYHKEIWTYPGKYITDNSIIVMPEHFLDIYNKDEFIEYIKEYKPLGICSDYIETIKNILN